MRNTTKNQYNVSCSAFEQSRCRSCTLLSENFQERYDGKQEVLRSHFKESGIAIDNILPLVSPSTIYPSRSKAKLSVTGSLDSPCIGLIDRNFEGIDLTDCPLHFPLINKVLNVLPEIISRFKITPYDISARKGELKHVILRTSPDQSELMLRFVLRSEEAISRVRKSIPDIRKRLAELSVVSCNLQPIPHAIVEGPQEIILTEQSFIWETYNTTELCFEPQSFSQVTPEIASLLYQQLANWVAADEIKSLVDLYCGVGGFALHCAKHVDTILGLELAENAIRCARLAADKNALLNCSFEVKDLGQAGTLSKLGFRPDAIVCNPPRRGISEQLIAQIIELKPKKLYYSSCDYQTLARDINRLAEHYGLSVAIPFDMFPLTKHMEVLAKLEILAK